MPKRWKTWSLVAGSVLLVAALIGLAAKGDSKASKPAAFEAGTNTTGRGNPDDTATDSSGGSPTLFGGVEGGTGPATGDDTTRGGGELTGTPPVGGSGPTTAIPSANEASSPGTTPPGPPRQVAQLNSGSSSKSATFTLSSTATSFTVAWDMKGGGTNEIHLRDLPEARQDVAVVAKTGPTAGESTYPPGPGAYLLSVTATEKWTVTVTERSG